MFSKLRNAGPKLLLCVRRPSPTPSCMAVTPQHGDARAAARSRRNGSVGGHHPADVELALEAAAVWQRVHRGLRRAGQRVCGPHGARTAVFHRRKPQGARGHVLRRQGALRGMWSEHRRTCGPHLTGAARLTTACCPARAHLQRFATAREQRLAHMIRDMVEGQGDQHWQAAMRCAPPQAACRSAWRAPQGTLHTALRACVASAGAPWCATRTRRRRPKAWTPRRWLGQRRRRGSGDGDCMD